MIEMWKVIYFALAAIFTVFWLVFFLTGKKKYSRAVQNARSGLPLQEIYFIGMMFLRWIRFPLSGPFAQRMQMKLKEVVGEEDPRSAYFLLRGGEATMILTGIPLGLVLGILSGKPGFAAAGLLAGGMGILILEDDIRDRAGKKEEQVLMELPSVLSKITLLVNSGMVLRDAWTLVARQGEGILYEEMRKTCMDLDNNMSEQKAFAGFAERCPKKEVKRLVMVITQNLSKGRTGLSKYLPELSAEIWRARELSVKEKAESASRKLMIPSFLIFTGIMIMAIGPMFVGFGLNF